MEEHNIDIKTYFNYLKMINIEKVHYTVFLSNKNKQMNDIVDEDEPKEINTNKISEENDDEEDNDTENKIESKSDTKSEVSVESNTEININEIYPKKMHIISLKSDKNGKIQNELFDFYFYFNLYYNYTYQTMKEMKTIFVNYDIIKRYIASIESSVTISFNDYDKTIIKSNQKGGLGDVKKTKKNTKKSIIKDLTIMSKLTRMTRHMNYIFSEYVNKVVYDIINDSSSRIAQKNLQDEIYYIKIGHYIINFLAYEKDGNFFNSFNHFKESEICKSLENDSYYLEALKISSQ